MEQCPEVFGNKSNRDRIESLLLNCGANLIIEDGDLTSPILTLDTELFLEFELTNCRNDREYMKGHDVLDGRELCLLKFYCERIPCSCLDGKYTELKKSRAKMEKCATCK
mmetsp:Transcript_24677/g.51638  ORF Transcript_24677/g.51638 Transcript_24677/m.51638 type:complete len:110 (-) Transcript_24677:119-448(-)